jgi:hypothetical protein
MPDAATMNFDDFSIFEADALAAGFDEALVRKWAPNQVVDEHSHPFDAHAVVTRGEMWLTQRGVTRHLVRGGRFELPNGEPHSERYGVDGAEYWVARRNR